MFNVKFFLILNLWRATLPKSLNRTPVCHDFAPEMQTFDRILERKYFVGEGEGRGRWEYLETRGLEVEVTVWVLADLSTKQK